MGFFVVLTLHNQSVPLVLPCILEEGGALLLLGDYSSFPKVVVRVSNALLRMKNE